MLMEEKFDYAKAMARLEKMAADAQDPATPLENVKMLFKACQDMAEG